SSGQLFLAIDLAFRAVHIRGENENGPEVRASGPFRNTFWRWSDLHKDNDQREQRERFNEYQTENHRRANRPCSSGVASHSFASRGGDTPLAKRSTEGRQRHAEACRNSEQALAARCRTGLVLGER